ncbi:PDZ domain-containing protein [Paenibacillus sp. sgz302251]|uniref:PDZ domain-containing protein n=1 Tax=Paenibacillus sp. sgz302251 TaxID=3414493 RepID=UPI003C798603
MKPIRYYLLGLAVALFYLGAAELIWLPGPLKTGGGMQWIEIIDVLFYGLALTPLSWTAGAIWSILAKQREPWNGFGMLLQLLRLVIAGLGLTGAVLVLFAPERLMPLLTVIGITMPLIFMEMLLSESLACTKASPSPDSARYSIIERAPRRLRMPWRSLLTLLTTTVLLLIMLYPTGYRVTYPGMTIDMNRYAHVESGASVGTVNGVLVFERPAVPADWLYAWLFPYYEFVKIPEDEPPLTELYSQVVMMKTGADSIAAAIAMEKAGVGKGITPAGVRVIAIVKDSPADHRLEAGDIIDRLDERPVRTISDMTDYMIHSVKPGQAVKVTLRRSGGQLLEIDVTAEASADSPQRPVFGISVQTELSIDIPRAIDYKRFMAHIGGPSHGAMLTLALIDQLTPGGVTHGLEVAGTGTIEPDGSIGSIGGIKQKAYAVSRTGADVFFVPAAQEDEARSGASDLHIVPVKTIDEVLDWLAQHGKRQK